MFVVLNNIKLDDADNYDYFVQVMTKTILISDVFSCSV